MNLLPSSHVVKHRHSLPLAPSSLSRHARLAHLEVDVSALGLLLLPGHVDERPLHVVVDDLRAAAGSGAHLLLVCRIALDAQPDLLQTALLQNLRRTEGQLAARTDAWIRTCRAFMRDWIY